jgi:rhodanese-related sulfurtransferase
VEIATRLSEILDLGYNTLGTEDVMRRLTRLDGDPLFVVDVRTPADFAAGHIPAAINIPLQDLPARLLDGTHGIPADTDVCVASYWGNDGTMAALLLNVFRVVDPASPGSYPQAKALFQGMTSWNFDRALVPAGTRFSDAAASGVIVSEPTEATDNPGTDQASYPDFAPFGVDPVVEKILLRAGHYLNSVTDSNALQMYPSDLADLLNDGNANNDPQIVSVRSETHYALGHIPGAVNVPYKSTADLVNYTRFVATDRLVVAYCYTGHTGGIGTVVLGILGYDVVNLLYGMNGWSQTAPASGQLSNFDVNRGWDFPLHSTGSGLTTLDGYVPPSTGCEVCHTNLTSVWYSYEIDPPPGGVEPPSSGEG